MTESEAPAGRRRPARARPGTTLTEMVVAALIFSMLIVVLLNAFTVTQRQATTGEAQLSSALLSQLVAERIKSTLAVNPRYLRDLMGGNPSVTFAGTVVDPASAVNPGKLPLSPFLEFLLARNAPDLWSPANQVTIAPASTATASGIKPAEMAGLVQSFCDYQVTVQIGDDAALEAPSSTSLPAEAVKRLTVTVARSSVVAAKGQDPMAHTVTARVLTPAASLSQAALKNLYDRFEGPPLTLLWDGFFKFVGANPYFLPAVFTLDDKRLLADAFLILAGANNECLTIEGTCVPGSTIIGAATDPSPQFIDPWILQMTQAGVYDLSSSKREVVRLRSRKSSVIFDTFKKIRHPIVHFNAHMIGPLPVGQQCLRDRVLILTATLLALMGAVDSAAQALAAAQAAASACAASVSSDPLAPPVDCSAEDAALASAQAALTASQNALAQFFVDNAPSIILCSFLAQFFTDPDYKDVAARPARYATRFHQTLEELRLTLEEHLGQSAGVTTYERTRSAQIYYELTMARQIESDRADTTAQVRLRALAAQYETQQAELARYLAGGEVYDMAVLKARNQPFVDRAGELKAESARYADVMALFASGGAIQRFLVLCNAASSKGGKKLGEALSALNDVLNQ